jgi:glycosyltransferase involved in cell wall biosynthesis
LHQNFTIPNIPSKTLDYFNVGLPVLASIDRFTDYDKVLEDAKAGLWSYAGDHQAFKNNFNLLYQNESKRKQMGINARDYFINYLTPEIAFQTVANKIKKI